MNYEHHERTDALDDWSNAEALTSPDPWRPDHSGDTGVGSAAARRARAMRFVRLGLESIALGALVGRTLRAERGHRAPWLATTTAVAGVAMLEAIGAARAARQRGPLRLQASVTINRSRQDVYAFWRDFRNLPAFMQHLESVDELDGLSVWRALGPGGVPLEWDAAIVADRPGERIAWRSLEDARVVNHGAVEFHAAPGGRGTEVHVDVGFDGPLGSVGLAVAKLLGDVPRRQLEADLRRLKQVLETGELVHSDASIHRGRHPARPAERSQLPLVKGRVRS
jgi:uncharacterized membrane protein